MTFTEVFNDLMRGEPVTRAAWVADDENWMMYYDLTSKSFVQRWASEGYETQCKFICITYEDMSADDWEVCEWDDLKGEEDEVSS